MVRRLLLILGVCLLFSVPAWATRERVQGWCQQGGVSITVPGTPGSGTQRFQQTFKGCTVTVYAAGTTTLSTIYSDSSGTAQANPFTANTTTGLYFFYADGGQYDVKFSAGGISTPFTLGSFRVPSEFNNVLDFGATGNGTTNDAAAITRAINLNGSVYFPCGTYDLGSGSITASADGVFWQGAGANCVIVRSSGTTTASIIDHSRVTISGIRLQNTNTNGTVLLIQGSATGSNYNRIENSDIVGNGAGAASGTNTSKCVNFVSTVTIPVYFNHVDQSFITSCNTAFNFDSNSNANVFLGDELEHYWKAFSFAGSKENIVRGNFYNNANGASAADPSIGFNLSGAAQYNDLEIPTGEPGTNSQAIAIQGSQTVTNNRFSNICSINYPLGLYQGGDATLGDNGTINYELDAPTCEQWKYRFFNLKENNSYRFGSFTLGTSNSGADIWLHWDSRNGTTVCASGGIVHAFAQNNAGTVTVKPVDVTEQSFGSGCSSFSGWDVSATTIYPVFFNTNNGTASTVTQTSVTAYTSNTAGSMSYVLTDKGAGNVAPGTVVTSNVATAQVKEHLTTTQSLTFNFDGMASCVTQTFTWPGGVLFGANDIFAVGIPNASAIANVIYGAPWSSSGSGLVAVRGCQLVLAANSPGAQTFRIDVWKY